MFTLEPDNGRAPSESSEAGGAPNPHVEALLEAIAAGRAIDWSAVRRDSGLPDAIIRQYQVLAGVAVVNRSPDGIHTDGGRTGGGKPDIATSIGHVLAAASTHPPSADATTSGVPWGPLRRLELVGKGAFGEVFRAYYPELETIVALKLIHAGRLTGAARTRAAADARLLARIRHPNIVTVHGAADVNGEFGVWMDFIHGRTLDQIVRSEGHMSAQEAMVIGESLCDALAAAHQAHVLHRDIKAENVMRETGGKIVLLDFGIGGDIVSADGTGIGAAGTPLYMAPELFDHAPASIQSDIYSLGVLLFYLVTGTFPVSGRTYDEVRDKDAARRRVLLADVRPGLPRHFLRIVERATAYDPAGRYATAGEMLADFDRPVPAATTWRTPAFSVAAAVLLLAAGPYVMGQLTTTAYNMALGRLDAFAAESLVETWVVGRRLLVLPAVYVLFTFLLCRLVGSVCGRVAAWPLLADRPMVRRLLVGCRRGVSRVAAAHPRSLTDALLFGQVAAVVAICWAFWGVVDAALARLSDTDPALLAPLRYGSLTKHFYLYSLCAAVLASVTAWARLLARYGPRQVGLVNTGIGIALIAALLVLVAVPYRLVFLNRSQRADYIGMRCYVTGVTPREHPERYLLYCPEAPVPKVRTVGAASLTLRDEADNIFTPVSAAGIGVTR